MQSGGFKERDGKPDLFKYVELDSLKCDYSPWFPKTKVYFHIPRIPVPHSKKFSRNILEFETRAFRNLR